MTKKKECCFNVGADCCFALTRKDCFNCKFRKTKEEYLEGIRNYPLRTDVDTTIVREFVKSLC